MLTRLLNLIFGCRHKRTTTPRKVNGIDIIGHDRGNYVSCLDCGKEMQYTKIKLPTKIPPDMALNIKNQQAEIMAQLRCTCANLPL